jgi:hypothetical protein
MPYTYSDEEDDIFEAIQSLQGEECKNIASLAREFGVGVRKLRARLNGKPSKLNNQNTTTRLTIEQDKALIMTLDRLEKTGVYARIPMVASIVNSILR